MNQKKNIDRLFQEKFKDFDVVPNDAVWDRISESLPHKKKKRRVIALWWQIGGVAALIALLVTVGISVFSSEDSHNRNLPVVNTDGVDFKKKAIEDALDSPKNYKQDAHKNSNGAVIDLAGSEAKEPSNLKLQKKNASQNKTKSDTFTTFNKALNNSVADNSNENEAVSTPQKPNKPNRSKEKDSKIADNTKTAPRILEQKEDRTLISQPELKSAIETTIEDQKTATTDNARSKNSENTENTSTLENAIDSVYSEDALKESIEDAIAEQNQAIDEKEKKDEQNRWSIAPNVAPVYYASLGQGSSIDQQFNGNGKNSDISMSYGIKGAYAVSKKLKIRAGINRVNLHQSTSNVFAFTGPEVSSRNSEAIQPTGNISFNNAQNVLLMSSEMLGISSTPEVFSSTRAGDLDQRFGFIEVPIELAYRVLDKTFGMNLIGGFSTFFLNENEIYADIEGTSTLIGEANNINGTSFSANFGLGLDYHLSKQWNVNLEPQFKYQINTFNNTTGEFRPFFIGVYTGLSFKF